ncbi:acyl-CoA dehydrogenase [Klebsiella grimontii]|uniref:Acyl-CoA dehydrogenase n=1 Tax=Klebsiella grimontii TaxID=2058152 RepID=A0A7H4P2G6_9ENTR|nr:acyl-CoA dehydrogenase [Klebsiella grimontii]
MLQPDAAQRDRSGIVPAEIIDTYSNSGLWGITVPRQWAEPRYPPPTLAQVIAIISAADPSLGQIPQNHYCLLEDIRLQGSEEQQAFFFDQVLQGYRFANALSETGGKTVLDIRTRLEASERGLRITGRKGYCTGSLYAHWIGILALDAENNAQLAFVPRESSGLTVIDDWACLGQRTNRQRNGPGGESCRRAFPPVPDVEILRDANPCRAVCPAHHRAIDLGIARAALNDTVNFVSQFARPWIDADVERPAKTR